MKIKKLLLIAAFAVCSVFVCDVEAQTPPKPFGSSEFNDNTNKTENNTVRGGAPVGSATLLLLSMLGCVTGAKLYMNSKKKGE